MYYDLYLSHHGIEGQKWGVRNGPPYPLDRNTPKRIVKKETKKFEKRIKREWVDSYNEASNKFNELIGELNQKYKGKDLSYPFDGPDGQKYIKEVNDLWVKLYSDSLIKNIGSHPSVDVGYNYIHNLPFMDMYLEFIK